MTTVTNTLFASPLDRLTDMKVGEVISYPAAEYWRVNARRTRAEQKTGGKFRIRKKDDQLFCSPRLVPAIKNPSTNYGRGVSTKTGPTKVRRQRTRP